MYSTLSYFAYILSFFSLHVYIYPATYCLLEYRFTPRWQSNTFDFFLLIFKRSLLSWHFSRISLVCFCGTSLCSPFYFSFSLSGFLHFLKILLWVCFFLLNSMAFLCLFSLCLSVLFHFLGFHCVCLLVFAGFPCAISSRPR